jgi:hypothetical protein
MQLEVQKDIVKMMAISKRDESKLWMAWIVMRKGEREEFLRGTVLSRSKMNFILDIMVCVVLF